MGSLFFCPLFPFHPISSTPGGTLVSEDSRTTLKKPGSRRNNRCPAVIKRQSCLRYGVMCRDTSSGERLCSFVLLGTGHMTGHVLEEDRPSANTNVICFFVVPFQVHISVALPYLTLPWSLSTAGLRCRHLRSIVAICQRRI